MARKEINTNAHKNDMRYRLYDAEDEIDIEKEYAKIVMKKKRNEALKLHPNPIHYTEKSGWFTEVDDPSAYRGKRKIRKASEEKLLDALVEWYIDQSFGRHTIKTVFYMWLEWKRTPTNESNLNRITSSWNTYYLKEPLSQDLISKPMNKITSLELRTWAEEMMKKYYPVDKKKFSRMFSILNNCYEYASDEDIHIVSENLWTKARKKINPDLMVTIATPLDESQVFSDDERRQLKQLVYEDLYKKGIKPTSAGLQILFLLETGLRMGECCGLKWTDIRKDRLYIQRQANNNGVKEWTKTTNGFRDIPLTNEAKRILMDVMQFNEEHGYNAEWIFQSSNENYDYRLSYNAANNKLTKLCARIDSVKKSPHKLRKTCLSALLDSPEVNNRTVQRFAGHSDITTTLRYYNFDRKDKEAQARAIEGALALDDER